jgi:hypothetical protein
LRCCGAPRRPHEACAQLCTIAIYNTAVVLLQTDGAALGAAAAVLCCTRC